MKCAISLNIIPNPMIGKTWVEKVYGLKREEFRIQTGVIPEDEVQNLIHNVVNQMAIKIMGQAYEREADGTGFTIYTDPARMALRAIENMLKKEVFLVYLTYIREGEEPKCYRSCLFSYGNFDINRYLCQHDRIIAHHRSLRNREGR